MSYQADFLELEKPRETFGGCGRAEMRASPLIQCWRQLIHFTRILSRKLAKALQNSLSPLKIAQPLEMLHCTISFSIVHVVIQTCL